MFIDRYSRRHAVLILVLMLLLALLIILSCGGGGGDSQPVTSDQPNSPPAVPTGFTLTAGVGAITLSWNGATGTQHYHLYWTNDGTDPGITKSLIDNILNTSHYHSGLDYQRTYKYKLAAINDYGESALTTTLSGTPQQAPLATPTGVAVLAVNDSSTSITLNWDDHPEAMVTYTVYRKASTSSTGAVLATGLSASEYTDTNITPGAGYYYQVKAVADDGRESAYTTVVYGYTWKTVTETERNGPTSTLTTVLWGSYAETATANVDRMIIKGGYSGAYAAYNAASYKYYDYDLFKLTVKSGDVITYDMIKGTMSGTWHMGAKISEVYESYTGDTHEIGVHTFNSTHESYTYQPFYSTFKYIYLMLSMPDNLINTGPYSYEVRISIDRK